MKRLHISSVIVIGAVATLFSVRAPAAPTDTSSAAPSKEFACGAKDKPCPLQAWMKANMGPSVTEEPPPWTILETNLQAVADLAKPGSPLAAKYPDWNSIALKGKAGAKAHKLDGDEGVKASCKKCHDLYKKKFKDEDRDGPAPK
jgi:hypothetical protein